LVLCAAARNAAFDLPFPHAKGVDMRFTKLAPFGLGVILLFALNAFGQSTATLQGSVTDPKGDVVPNATITVRNEATSVERTAQSDSDGNYSIASLPVGTYTIEVQAQGFKRDLAQHFAIEVGRTIQRNFQLQVGDVSENITVTADAPVIESATTSVGLVINQRTVQEIPLNGRHFVDLGLLIPGSVTPPQNGFLTAPLRGQGSFGLNTAGGREDTVNFMINGINLNDMVQNQITFQPSINTVQEFKADNSTFSAEYGRNSGAIVNIATRSGTNDFHGEFFEFLRNDALDARNFFNFCPPGQSVCKSQGKPPFKRNQFGFNIGGPIYLPRFGEGGSPLAYNGKNKTFFFFSYEGLRQRQGLTLPTTAVPTDAQRAAVTAPAIQKLLALIPRSSTGFTSGSATAPVNIDQWTLDISHQFSSNDRLHGYYAFQRDQRGEPNLQGNNIPGFGDTRKSHRQIFTLNETHTFGSSLVNEVRFGFNRIHILFSPNAKLNPLDFGINDGVTEPIGLPQIAVGGGGVNLGGPAGFPQGRSDTTYVLSDTLNYLRGKHSLKFGVEARKFFNNNTNKDTGSFAFANTAAFVAGTANAFAVTLGDVSTAIAQGALGLFAQDNYKVRSNLTLELGLRWDYLMSPTERYDRFVDYVPQSNSLIQVNHGIAPVYHTNWKNFHPRVGFSWDPFKDGKTSVRAAYAILADQPVTNLVTGNGTNPPFATNVALPSGSTTTLGNAILAAPPGATVSPSSSDPFFDNAYIQSYNFNIQREVKSGLAVTVGYFGSKGTHLRLTRNLNQTFLNSAFNAVRPFPTLSSTSPIRPGATLLNITFREATGNSNYNALWVTADKRMGHGLQFNASYTFSKSIDYNSQSSQGVTVQDSYNLRGDRGLSDFDARHRFVISGLYELPWKKNSAIGGWQTSLIVQSQSGNPVTLLAGNVGAITGGAGSANANSLTGLATLRPDVGAAITINPVAAVGSNGVQWFPNLVCDPRPGGSCPSGSVAILPVNVVSGNRTIYHFGNIGRNTVIGPSFNNVDFSLIKRTKIGENKLIEFRWEIFDLFNHANFGQPGRTAQVGSTSFGVITNTRFPTGDSGSSRQMQFALKFKY
jgi:hypothetical protein